MIAAGLGTPCVHERNQVSDLRDGIERLAGFMLHLLWVHCTATLAECTNFLFWSHGGRHRGLRLWTIDGDYHDNPSRLTLMWREGKAGEPIKFPSLINRIHACAYEMILVIHARSWVLRYFFVLMRFSLDCEWNFFFSIRVDSFRCFVANWSWSFWSVWWAFEWAEMFIGIRNDAINQLDRWHVQVFENGGNFSLGDEKRISKFETFPGSHKSLKKILFFKNSFKYFLTKLFSSQKSAENVSKPRIASS